jgi:CRISPR-associated endonuclease/helicase Cas3
MSDLDISQFAEFFAAVNNGHEPYSWQQRLVETLGEEKWPERIVAPTGAGKSVLLEAHVFLRALAIQNGRRHPRRLVLSVGRRALIDAQAQRARAVASALDSAETGILRTIADLLRRGAQADETATADGHRPAVAVSVLRGGMAVDRSWEDDPLGCQILCITPDLLGSRMLFRGYLARKESWARAAGLLAYDTLAVIDESHLNTQLVTTLRRIGRFASDSPLAASVPPLRVLETTATPPALAVDELTIMGEESDTTALGKRLTAGKTLELLPVPAWPLPRNGALRAAGIAAIVDRAEALHGGETGTIGVIVNRVRDAVEIAAALRARELRVAALVGPMRPFDRRRLEQDHPGLLTPDGTDDVDVLVATQTVEVGVDLDLRAMLLELAPGPSLVQRLGRLNRRGLFTDAPAVAVVPESGAALEKTAPYEVADLEAALAWLRELGDGAQVSAAALARTAVPPVEPGRMLEGRLSLTEAAYLARGSDSLVAEPDLEFWISDSLAADQPQVSIVGRRLPDDHAASADLLSVARPVAEEMFPVGIGTARRILLEEAGLAALFRGGELLRMGERSDIAGTLLPGDVLVVSEKTRAASSGVIVDKDVQGRSEIGDVSESLEPRSGARISRVLLPRKTRRAGGAPSAEDSLLGALARAVSEITAESLEREREAVLRGEERPEDLPRPTWEEVLSRLPASSAAFFERALGPLPHMGDREVMPVLGFPMVANEDGAFPWFTVTWVIGGDISPEELQEFTAVRRKVPLDAHQRSVGDRAAAWGHTLGLSAGVIDVLRAAGAHHDDGKSATPFQLRLGRKSNDPLLAKSGDPMNRTARHRAASSLPAGWRHEQLSVAIAWDSLPPATRELTARLIGTSHGHGRVDFPHMAHDLITPDMAAFQDTAEDLFDHGGWDELMDSTDEEWGLWGVAYLEAVLRAADNTVSQEGN